MVDRCLHDKNLERDLLRLVAKYDSYKFGGKLLMKLPLELKIQSIIADEIDWEKWEN